MLRPHVSLFLVLALTSLAWGATPEPPPADETRLSFQKTLYVHDGPQNKIFAETRKINRGDTIWQLLKKEYGVSDRTIPSLVQVFREVNPGVDPNVLQIGQVVRVPFKVESALGSVPMLPPQPADDNSYIVRPGDSLWKILKKDYGVAPGVDMKKALAAVAAQNPDIADLNRLWVGQMLIIPLSRTEQAKPAPPVEVPQKTREQVKEEPPGVPKYFLSVLDLLAKMGCRTDREGQIFIPIERGRTVRMDKADFPVVIGPSGSKVILDPDSRLSGALVDTIKNGWGYEILQGVSDSVEKHLEALLPRLGFFELSEGERPIALGGGAMLKAMIRWTVIPTTDDLWKGHVHLIYSRGDSPDPRLAALAKNKGFIIHRLMTDSAADPASAVAADISKVEIPTLDNANTPQGAAVLLSFLGITHKLDPELTIKLKSGVSYKLKPLLIFMHAGLNYAIPPQTPKQAETVLLKGGYFTFEWPESTSVLNKLGDLLSLLGVEHEQREVQLPAGGPLRLEAGGLTVKNDRLTATLCPEMEAEDARVFLTEAALPAGVAALFLEEGLCPWIVQ